MIIEGGTHNSARNLARYLLNPKENEREFLLDLRDAATDNLRGALTDWELCGRSLTKGDKILFHSYLRLRDGEALTESQWIQTIDRLEEQLGLMNCPRAIVGHNNAERGLHVHVVWSRLDMETEKLAPLHHSRRRFHEVARWAEKEFALDPVPVRERKRNDRKLEDREIKALKEAGADRDTLAKFVTAAWKASDSGEEMKAMLNALGVELKPGDRRDYVVEYKGVKMNPVRLLDGVRAADFRERMKDVPIEKERDESVSLLLRRAKDLVAAQAAKELANDNETPAPKQPTRRKQKAPEPRLKRKMWYGDPGI
jgi:hypothetical protein